VDRTELDRQPLTLGIGDDPDVTLVGERIRSVHPVERLVGPPIGMDGDASGHGFGLPGMRERVESLGGAIHLASRRGRGVTLTVELPLAETEEA